MAMPQLITRVSPISTQASLLSRTVQHGAAAGANVRLQGCDLWDWAKCAVTVLACAGVCAAGPTPACLACAGSAYYDCKDCF